MRILFPQNIPTVVTTKTEREQLIRTETTLRHAGIVPGGDDLVKAANIIREFVDAQQQQSDADVEQLADLEESPSAA